MVCSILERRIQAFSTPQVHDLSVCSRPIGWLFSVALRQRIEYYKGLKLPHSEIAAQ
jgi:hypothetical protein